MEENNNKTNNEKRIIPVRFTTVPNLLIQSDGFLDPIERDLVVLFLSYVSAGGCVRSKESLKKRLGCGPYHLNRAINRLVHRHMVKVIKGRWKKSYKPQKETHRYVFERDPYKWRVTEEMQEKIVQETYEMGMEPKAFIHAPFSNDYGFEESFKLSHPQYAKGRKGRKKKNQIEVTVEETAPIEVDAETEMNWREEKEKLLNEPQSLRNLVLKYYLNYKAIEEVRNTSDHGIESAKADYLEKLHHIFITQKREQLDPYNQELIEKINEWEASGTSSFDIYFKILTSRLGLEK